MYIAGLNLTDIANGTGCRVSLFVSGCDFHCPGCFNPEAQHFSFGKPYTEHTLETILSQLSHDHIRGLTVLGGEPLHPNNIECVYSLIYEVKTMYPNKDIWVYSGYTYEDLVKRSAAERYVRELFFDDNPLVDVLVDGPFVMALKDHALAFRGSSNQRIIDVHHSSPNNPHIIHLDQEAPAWRHA